MADDSPSQKKKTDIPTVIFVGVLMVGAALLGWQEFEEGILPVHSPAPLFAAERWNGDVVDLPSLRGRVVVINFWATWCPPCREEIPVLVQLAAEYEAQGVTLLAVNTDDMAEQREIVEAFLPQFPSLTPYVVLGQPEIGERYNVRALPSVYVVDRKGLISASFRGQATEGQLRRWIEVALHEE